MRPETSQRVVYVIESVGQGYERRVLGKSIKATEDLLDPRTHYDTLAVALMTRNMHYPDARIRKVQMIAICVEMDGLTEAGLR